jgi:restriction system protein
MEEMYMIRAGKNNYLFDLFEEKNIVAIGWNELGNISLLKNSGQIKEKLSELYDYKQQTTNMNAGQIFRFIEMKIGDYAVTYNSEERVYMIGKIASDYIYNPSFEFSHQRAVKWNGRVSRDVLSSSTKNSLGSIATIFHIKDAAKKELLDKLNNINAGNKISSAKVDIEETVLKEDPEVQALNYINDKVMRLSWDDMQELVAALLRSFGFKTKVSPKGPDRGIDIIASPDELGLEEPRVCVEVKHRREEKIGAPEIRSFIQSVRFGGKGLYISTGGFSKEARYEAERANIPLTLIGIDELVNLIISNYDNFDSKGRKLLTLKKIYWPE